MVSNEKDKYANLLYRLFYELHPVYPSTAGPYGGIGGQAITQWCHVKDFRIEDLELISEIESALSDYLKSKET